MVFQIQVGFTALHLASLKGETDIVQLLINSGAQVDIPAKVNMDEWMCSTSSSEMYLKAHLHESCTTH